MAAAWLFSAMYGSFFSAKRGACLFDERRKFIWVKVEDAFFQVLVLGARAAAQHGADEWHLCIALGWRRETNSVVLGGIRSERWSRLDTSLRRSAWRRWMAPACVCVALGSMREIASFVLGWIRSERWSRLERWLRSKRWLRSTRWIRSPMNGTCVMRWVRLERQLHLY